MYPVVGEQVIDRIYVAAQNDSGEDIGEVSLRVDTASFAGFDEAGERRPVFSSQVMACEQGIFPLQGNGPDRPLDGDRQRVVEGQSVSVRVGLGGRRIFQTQHNYNF